MSARLPRFEAAINNKSTALDREPAKVNTDLNTEQ